jgi:signal transduction histidine kinase
MKGLRDRFLNPTIGSRLRLGFGIMLVLLVAVTVFGVGRLFQLRQDFEGDNGRAFQLELAAERLRSAFILEQAALRGSGRSRAAKLREYRQAADVADNAAAAALSLIGGDDPSDRALRSTLAAERRWRNGVAGPILRARPPNPQTAARRAGDVVNAVNQLLAHQRSRRVELRKDVRDESRRTAIFVLAGLAVGFVIAVLIFGGLVNSMRAPLADLVRGARRLSSGQLDARVEVGGPGETAELGMAFNEMASDLEEASRRIEDERQRLSTMIESLGDGLVTVDAEGRITLTNPAARAMLPDAHPGVPLEEAFGPLSPDPEALRELLAGHNSGELRLTSEEKVLAVLVAPLETREAGTVLSIRDMSDRARLERMKDDFLVTVSHELRSPLTSIKGFAELLRMKSKGLTKEQSQSVEVIEESTSGLVELVNDLLDLARSDAGRLSITQRPCDAGQLIEDVAALLRPRMQEKNQDLRIAVQDGLPKLFADPDRVKQILINLLTNAHVYTQDGGEIELGARRVEDGVELTVADNGPGIPIADQEHLFERFWRAQAGETQTVSGSGLGLPIVKSLVDLHGGEIGIHSESGKGTICGVVLPSTEVERLPEEETAR